MAMKENTRKVLDYLKEVNGKKDVTAAMVAEELGLEKKSVDGSFTSFQKKGFGIREEAQVKEGDKYVNVKYLRLTQAGLDFDPDAEVEA